MFKSTGKLQGLLPRVSVKMNGSVGSGFGCLVGGTALANPGASEIRMSPTAIATQLASGRHVLSRLFRHDILTPLQDQSSNDLEPPSGELIGIRERVNPSPSRKPWLGLDLRNLRIATVCDHSCLLRELRIETADNIVSDDRSRLDRYCIKGSLDKVERGQSPYTIGTSEGRAPHLQALEVPEAP
jgi:hypothetical protein